MSEQPVTAGGITLTVDKDTVLAVHQRIANRADILGRRVDDLRQQMRQVPCAADPVSVDAAKVMNCRFIDAPDSHVNRAVDFARELRRAAEALHQTALQYGYTEDEIAATFRGRT